MLKNLRIWAVAATVALATAACSSTEEKDAPQIPAGEKTAVKLNLSVAPAAAASTVNNVWVLQWDAAGNNKVCYKERYHDTSAPLEATLLAGSDMKVAVIANVGDGIVYQLGTSYADFCQKAYANKITSEAQIPYSGIQQVSINKAGQAIDLPLKWIAAKVSFKIASSTEGYTLKSAQVKNVPTKMYLLPNVTAEQTYDVADAVLTDFDKTYSFFVSENPQGTVSGITSAKDRITTKKATYVEVVGTKTLNATRTTSTFVSFFGNNDTDNFDVNRGSSYTQELTIDFDAQDDKRVTRTETDANLNLAEASNSYILSPTETIPLGIPVSRVNEFWTKYYADNRYVIDNGVNDGAVKNWVAKIIWETEPNLIRITTAEGSDPNGIFVIEPSKSGKSGNVLIGLFDASKNSDDPKTAKALWSWHIWVTDYNPGGNTNGAIPTVSGDPGCTTVPGGHVHYFSSLSSNVTVDGSKPVIMDRDLGALACDPTNLKKSTGLYYQWGRKDPFYVKLHEDSEFPTTGNPPVPGYGLAESVPNATDHISLMEGPVGFSVSVQSPATFITTGNSYTDAGYDWLQQGSNNNFLWSDALDSKKKTFFDPCPPGWRIPMSKTTYESLASRSAWEPSSFDPSDIEGNKAAGIVDDEGYYNKLPLQGVVCWDNSTRFYSNNAGGINCFNGKLFSYGDDENWLLGTAISIRNGASVWQHSRMGINIKEGTMTIFDNWVTYRTSGNAVRCVKE